MWISYLNDVKIYFETVTLQSVGTQADEMCFTIFIRSFTVERERKREEGRERRGKRGKEREHPP